MFVRGGGREGVSALFGGGRKASVCSPSAVETQQQIHEDANRLKHLHPSCLRRQRRAVSMATGGIDRRSTDRPEDALQIVAR